MTVVAAEYKNTWSVIAHQVLQGSCVEGYIHPLLASHPRLPSGPGTKGWWSQLSHVVGALAQGALELYINQHTCMCM